MCPGFNTKSKFYGVHQLLIIIFMFPWLREAFNFELNEIKYLINTNPTVNLIKKQSNQFTSLENSLNNIQQPTQQSPELQLIKIKRFYEENNAKSSNNSFKINKNTIIRTQDSRNNGAKYLNETEFASNDDCLKWCLQNKQCNLAVYEEKDQGSCYLFDCGTADDFKCKFTKHNFYTSSILEINREKQENKNSFQQQNLHENDLVNLRTNVPINSNLTNVNNKSKTNLTTKQTLKEEDNKIPAQKCEKYQFACKNGNGCIAIYNTCDGISQCADGSDEAPELHCPDSSNQISQLLSINSKPTNEAPVTTVLNKDPKIDKISLPNHFQAPNFNYKKLPEVIKLDKAPNNFQLNNQPNFPNSNNVIKPWPSILNLDQNGYPITNWNDYNAYYNALNNFNNNKNPNNQQNSIPPNSKDFNSMVWQMMDPNQQQQQQKNFFDALANSNQQNQQQFLQNLFNKQQLNNWMDNSNKNSAALSFINYLNSKQQQQDQKSTKSIAPIENSGDKLINQNPINLLNKNKTENIVTSNIVKASLSTTIETSTNTIPKNTIQSSNLNKERYVSYDFKQPFIQYNGKDDFYLDDNEQDNNSAVIALILGLFITVLLVLIVGLRMRSIKKRIQRRGARATLAHDADYLINGMYL